MMGTSDSRQFASIVLPYLDEAYSLARWLMGGDSSAEDVVQEAMLRALTYFRTFKGQNPRAWILQIVRNVAYATLRERQRGPVAPPMDRNETDANADEQSEFSAFVDPGPNPETLMAAAQQRSRLNAALAELPLVVRECLVLHELHDCSYREIASITDVPIGTVTSRIWRGRRMLAKLLADAER